MPSVPNFEEHDMDHLNSKLNSLLLETREKIASNETESQEFTIYQS